MAPILSGREEFVLLSDVVKLLCNNCLQGFAESVEKSNRVPHLQFLVVRLHQLVKGYCYYVLEALWVVAVVQTHIEEFVQTLLYFLEEKLEDTVWNTVRA